MIPMLLAAAIIPSRCLQVTLRICANPNLLPCRRYRERFDSFQNLLIRDDLALLVSISKALARLLAANSREVIGYIMQSDRSGRFNGVLQFFEIGKGCANHAAWRACCSD